ncbi:MAG: serine protease [Verrucomicrobiota bacterium]|jgi:hypothetical protein
MLISPLNRKNEMTPMNIPMPPPSQIPHYHISALLLRLRLLVFLAAFLNASLSLRGASLAIPFLEGFESANRSHPPAAWIFEATGAGWVGVDQNVRAAAGSNCLVMNQSLPCCGSFGSESATLQVDLAGRSHVTLDFIAQQASTFSMLSSAYVAISPDGIEWTTAATLNWSQFFTIWRHVSLNLDAIAAEHGIPYTADFRIRFSFETPYYGRGSVWLWDQIRITTDADVTGPAVAGFSVSGPALTAIGSCRVLFTEPIDFSTLVSNPVRILDPAGRTVPLDGNVPITLSEDQTTVTFRFAEVQTLPGRFRFELDQHVSDLQGNWLDQNVDGMSGNYPTNFTIASGVVNFPVNEKFSPGNLDALSKAWQFETTDVGRISVVPESPGTSGRFNLRMEQSGFASESAVLTVNLAGRTNVMLDFDVKEESTFSMLGTAVVSVSPDGTNWVIVRDLSWSSYFTVWGHVSLELDPVLIANGWSYGSQFQIRFSFETPYYGRGCVWLWRDILVSSLTPAHRALQIRKNPAGFELGFSPEPNFDYTVQSRNRFNAEDPWQSLPGAPHNSGKVVDAMGASAERFYRLLIQPR